ncbi:MAG TPA: methylamine utilization protein [Steroidobacteraceae bacterium]|jgi:plastocyanin|nr:methylamine utilization protein [Steroidobacteraceae bacterium]
MLHLLLCVGAPAASAASLAIHVQKKDGKPLVGAVLTVAAESPRLPPAAPTHAVVDQVDLAFVPDVIVIPVGSTISFPNSDAVSHQVYSFSSARRFQLPLYRGKPYPPVTFDRPGLVTLGCNIHDNMLAYVVVTDAPFFGRTDAHGDWIATNIPNGTYRVTLWHPLLSESGASVERTVHVDGTERAELAMRLSRALRPAPISSRPHSWDY